MRALTRYGLTENATIPIRSCFLFETKSLITSLTTLLVLFSLYLMGGELIKNFALALIFGVIVGTYSSIYIASNALIMMGLTKDHLKVEDAENPDPYDLP